MEEYIKAHVSLDDSTNYKDADTTMQDIVKRLHGIASKARESYLNKEGKEEFTTEVNSFWERYLTRILSCKQVSHRELQMLD